MNRVQAGPGGDDLRKATEEHQVASRYDLGECYVVDCKVCEDEEDDVPGPLRAEWVLTICMPWALVAIGVILIVTLIVSLKYR
jgi:hypothetical protein